MGKTGESALVSVMSQKIKSGDFGRHDFLASQIYASNYVPMWLRYLDCS